jgi:hypothetical protein
MKIRIVFFSLLIPWAFSACEKIEKIEDFPLVAPSLVLNAALHAGDSVRVSLSRSLSVLDNANLSLVENGSVSLFQDGVELEKVEGPLYEFSTMAEEGTIYEIRASAPTYNAVSAVTKVPSKVQVTIGDITVREQDSGAWGHLGDSLYYLNISDGQIEIEIQDNAGEENYYSITIDADIKQSPGVQNEFYTYATFTSDPTNGERIGDKIFLTDELKNGSTIRLPLNFAAYYNTQNKSPFMIKVRVSVLSRERYLYEQSYERFVQNQNNPFADPVQVYNNIDGGFGIFGGLSTVETTKQL